MNKVLKCKLGHFVPSIFIRRETGIIIVKLIFLNIFIHPELHQYTGGTFNGLRFKSEWKNVGKNSRSDI